MSTKPDYDTTYTPFPLLLLSLPISLPDVAAGLFEPSTEIARGHPAPHPRLMAHDALLALLPTAVANTLGLLGDRLAGTHVPPRSGHPNDLSAFRLLPLIHLPRASRPALLHSIRRLRTLLPNRPLREVPNIGILAITPSPLDSQVSTNPRRDIPTHLQAARGRTGSNPTPRSLSH